VTAFAAERRVELLADGGSADETSGETPPAAPEPAPETWTPGTTPPAPTYVPPPVQPVQPYPTSQFRIGAAVLLGGGFEDFTNSAVRSMTGGGGAWNARFVAGTRQFVGMEAAYVGAARSINTLGLANDTSLVNNGLEGNLRVQVPVPVGRSLIEPFGFGGVGWQHYSLTNTAANTSDLLNNDDVLTLPVGGGLEYSYAMFMADARFTYRYTYYNNLFPVTGEKLNNWGVGGNIGVEF
jgi:hypothetical protein